MGLAAHQKRNGWRIAVAQRKGGVGKTTIAVSLAAELGRRSNNVVLVDADPLRSACEWAALGSLHFPVHDITFTPQGAVAQWAGAVKRVHADYVVVDTPPSEEALAASIALAHVTIIPCLPSGLDIDATMRTLEIVTAVRKLRGDEVQVILVPNRVDWRTLEGRQLVEELQQFGETLASPIGNRSAFARAFSTGCSIGDFDPHSAGVQEIRELCDLVDRCLKAAVRQVKIRSQP